MRFVDTMLNRLVWLLVVTAGLGICQKPIGVAGYIGNPVDYWGLTSGGSTGQPTGDTYYFGAYGSNSMLPLFPNSSGLPIIGTPNDGTSTFCSGNVSLVQLVKLPSWTVVPTTGNTNIQSYTNCPNLGNVNGWATECTTGGGVQGCTWKGGNAFFRNNILFLPIYRQDNQGSIWGDSTLFMSPDAGSNWTDAGRYNASSVTGISCTGGTVTVSAVNTNSIGDKIYLHNVNPSGYNNVSPASPFWTLTAVSGTQVTFSIGVCPGAYVSGGKYATLFSTNWTPAGPASGSYPASMMWLGSPNQMVWMLPIQYGQDGSYPVVSDSACDPNTFVCAYYIRRQTSGGNAVGESTVLARVPVGSELDTTQYQWYTCATYNATWPTPIGVCDGNNNANWTSTLGSATSIRMGVDAGLTWPGDCMNAKYLSSHGSIIWSCITYLGTGRSNPRQAYLWAPHPWGPIYQTFSNINVTTSFTTYTGFTSTMQYGDVSTTVPPDTQMHTSFVTQLGTHAAGGTPGFNAIDANSGRNPFVAGIARRANYLNYGQMGIGHRLSSGSWFGAIPTSGVDSQGNKYTLDFLTDIWDHGGSTVGNVTARPYFRDLVTNGAHFFNVTTGASTIGLNQSGANLVKDGMSLVNSLDARLQGSWTDSTVAGNANFTMFAVFQSNNGGWADAINENSAALMFEGTGVVNNSVVLSLSSYHLSSGVNGGDNTKGVMGDACLRWGGPEGYFTLTNQVAYCLPSTTASNPANTGTILINKWYFVAVSAKANVSGFPTVTMVLCSAGSCTVYGGVDQHADGDLSTKNGLIKHCPNGGCTATPNVTAGPMMLGYNPGTGTNKPGPMLGTIAEAGLYSGIVPVNTMISIYKTISNEWKRVGRGLTGGPL